MPNKGILSLRCPECGGKLTLIEDRTINPGLPYIPAPNTIPPYDWKWHNPYKWEKQGRYWWGDTSDGTGNFTSDVTLCVA
jgi:hypothetical protein